MAPRRLSRTGRGDGEGARERMGLETASIEECNKLFDEINEIVRRAGNRRGSSRGRGLCDDWCPYGVEPANQGGTAVRRESGGDALTALFSEAG